MATTINEVWKTIKEFPGYQVSDLGNVKNKKGCLLKIHDNEVYMCVGGKKKGVSIRKLMYSVFFGVEINKLKNVRTLGRTLKTLQVIDMDTYFEKLRQDRKTRKYDSKEIEKSQIETFEDIRILLEAWNFGKQEALYARINSYKRDTISYIQYRFRSSESTAESVWDESSYLLFTYIMGKERSIGSFRGWLYATSKNLIRQYREASIKKCSFEDKKKYKWYD